MTVVQPGPELQVLIAGTVNSPSSTNDQLLSQSVSTNSLLQLSYLLWAFLNLRLDRTPYF